MPRRAEADLLRFRITVSRQAHPALWERLRQLPENARGKELVLLAAGQGADPRLLALMERLAVAVERLQGGDLPRVAAPEEPPAAGGLPPGLNSDEWD